MATVFVSNYLSVTDDTRQSDTFTGVEVAVRGSGRGLSDQLPIYEGLPTKLRT